VSDVPGGQRQGGSAWHRHGRLHSDAGPPPTARVFLMRADPARTETLLSRHVGWLSAVERQQLDGQRHAAIHATMALGRLLLRRCLAAATGRSEADHEIEAGPTGKPRLRGGGVEFNLSHAGDLVAVAIAPHPVGIDLEAIETLPRVTGNASPFYQMDPALSPAEKVMLLALPEADRRQSLLGLWIRKEALVKCDGRGLAIDPATICLVTGARPPGLVGLRLACLDPVRGFGLALAQPRATHGARMRRLDALPAAAALAAANWTAVADETLRPDAEHR
jgi:4'-phosphopantetheinyl transferase